MEFAVLGPLQVRDGDRGMARTPSQRRLLALLLCRPNIPMTADTLTAGLWDEAASAGDRLQVLVHRLRKSLGDPGRIRLEQGSYELRVLAGELDAERFSSLRQEGTDALAAGDPDKAARQTPW